MQCLDTERRENRLQRHKQERVRRETLNHQNTASISKILTSIIWVKGHPTPVGDTVGAADLDCVRWSLDTFLFQM